MKNLFMTILLFLLVSCSNKNIQTRIDYVVNKYSKTFGNCDSTSTYCVKLKVSSPEITTLAAEFLQIKDKINRQIDSIKLMPFVGDERPKTLDEMADTLINQYISFKKDFPDAPYIYEAERNITVEADTSNIFSILLFDFYYFGGAHPNTYLQGYNFDKRTGRIVTLNEIIKSVEGLSEIAEKYFRKVRGLTADANLEKSGFWFKDGKFELTKNFTISKNHELVLYYNAYEIAPYSFGQTIIKIPLKELVEIKTENGLL